MGNNKRFLIGGLGALMPILVSLLAIDIGAILDDHSNLTTGNIVGFLVRYAILFLIGGFVAYLHQDEQKPFKLFEIGIAAPALISSLITAQGINAPSQATIPDKAENSIPGFFISSVSASEFTQNGPDQVIYVAGFFSDMVNGATGKVYSQPAKPAKKPTQSSSKKPPTNKGANTSQSTTKVNKPKLRNLDSDSSSLLLPSPTQEENRNISKEALKRKLDNAQLELEAVKLKVESLEKQYQLQLAE